MELANYDLLVKYLNDYFPDMNNDESSYKRALDTLIKLRADTFSEQLRYFRAQRGISQIALCNELNTTQSTYSAWETGKHLPKSENIIKICKVLKIRDPILLLLKNRSNSKGSEIYQESGFSKTATLLPAKFFEHLTFSDFYEAKKVYEDTPLCDYCKLTVVSDKYDFAFIAEENQRFHVRSDNFSCDDMKEVDFSIGITLLCKSQYLNNKSKEELLESLNGRIILLSINRKRGAVRQVFYSPMDNTVTVDNGNRLRPQRERFSLDDIEIFGVVVAQQWSLC